MDSASLKEIPGIGEGIAKKIVEFNTTGAIVRPAPVETGKVSRTGKSEKRYLRKEVEDALRDVLSTASGLPYAMCGSYRRERPDVGDVDILIIQYDIPIWKKKFTDAGATVINEGPKSVDLIYKGIPVNLRSVEGQDQWGAGLLFLTGPQAFNIWMRSEAKKQGYKLNQYGLWFGETLVVKSVFEKDIFKQLNMPYIEPEDR